MNPPSLKELLSFMGRTSVKRDGAERGLRQYYNEDWSVPEGFNPFMSEIAHLAVNDVRTSSQEKLAEEYRKIPGHNAIQAANIKKFFETKRLSGKVVSAFQRIFDLSDKYVNLLLAIGSNKPYLDAEPEQSLRLETLVFVRENVPSESDIALLFEPRAVEAAVRLMRTDKALAVKCVNEAELWAERFQAFDVSVPRISEVLIGEPLEIDRRQLRALALDEVTLVKWLAIAKVLRRERNVDLLASETGRRTSEFNANELEAKRTLLVVWRILKSMVSLREWRGIEKKIETVLRRRGLPIDDMRSILRNDTEFDLWTERYEVSTEIEVDCEKMDKR